MEGSRLRVRLVFEDGGILSKTQKKEGLKCSWVLLKPQLETISDVVSYLLHSFDLYDSCPNGIVLSMDGFILPPFESTAILKDRDLIRVKKKGTRFLHGTMRTEGAGTLIEDKIIDMQPLPSHVKFLANEEFDKETGGYQSESDEDDDEAEKPILPVDNVHTSKKRKASSKVGSSKAKRQRRSQSTPESVKMRHENGEHVGTPNRKKKQKHENVKKRDSLSNLEVTAKCTPNLDPAPDSEDELEENKEGTKPASIVPGQDRKCTRSSRRKKLKRKFKRENREKTKLDKLEEQLPVLDMKADLGSIKGMATNTIEHQIADEDSDGDGDLVPIEIRPGHIRFTPSGKVKDIEQNQESSLKSSNSADKDIWESHSAMKDVWGDPSAKQSNWTAQKSHVEKWNGITNKRKGQKWGKEKQPSNAWKNSREYTAQSSCKWPAENKLPCNAALDFDKLVPLIDCPKAGDVIAYRLLELTASWCPELSSFRMGKISWFEPESNKIMLLPDPEYPLNLEKKKDNDDDDYSDDPQPPQSSLYNEDGSLEIDFPSLVDVRIVKRVGLSQSEGTQAPAVNGTLALSRTIKRVDEAGLSRRDEESQDPSKKVTSDACNGELHSPAPVNGKRDVWEEISEALSAKKAELTQQDKWKKKENSSNRSWSNRALRSSALGPTMAMLRAQNGI